MKKKAKGFYLYYFFAFYQLIAFAFCIWQKPASQIDIYPRQIASAKKDSLSDPFLFANTCP